MPKQLPLSLCTFVKNEERQLRDCIESVRPIVREIVIVDTGSTDKTLEIARSYTDRVYSVGFSDFGSIRTITAHLSNQPWILMLDADERIDSEDWEKFEPLLKQPIGVQGNDMELNTKAQPIIDSYALPRKRWADVWRTQQVEMEAYPDWQVRLFRNHINRQKIKFVRRVHETVKGCVQTVHLDSGPTIHHLQNVQKNKEALKDRANLYTELYNKDMAEGVEHYEPPIVDLDKD